MRKVKEKANVENNQKLKGRMKGKYRHESK
jgi:hypothetical protein